MKIKSAIFFLLILNFTAIAVFAASSVADTLNQVQVHLKEKDFSAARSLLTQELKSNRNEYKLWLALGYVYEAEQNYEMALKAFSFASEIKTNIPGLSERIIRLQELVKANARELSGETTDTDNQTLIEKARYLIAFGKELEGFKTFYEAVEADRSILSNDYGLIGKGLDFFRKNQNEKDARFYLGAFTYFSGQYEKASILLEDFISRSEDSPRQEDAKRLLKESRGIIQMAAARNVQAQADNTTPAPPRTPDKEPTYEEPDYVQVEPGVSYESNSGESFAITLARQKALKLLEEYDSESDSRKKLQIIWRLGLIRLPLPEVMAKMAEFLSTDDIQTIVATLTALTKIGNPGAQVCAPYVVNLLDNDEFVIKWSAIITLEKLPLMAGRAIPKLLKIYRNEKRSSRQGIILRTINGYGSTGITILKKMLEDATGPNKRPIAEVLSILTGEDVETLIRDS